jgi:hypothetical protein
MQKYGFRYPCHDVQAGRRTPGQKAAGAEEKVKYFDRVTFIGGMEGFHAKMIN